MLSIGVMEIGLLRMKFKIELKNQSSMSLIHDALNIFGNSRMSTLVSTDN